MSTLDNLRREAKQWLKALRSKDSFARARLAKAWPDAPAAPTLRDVQHALAREHGFDSWVAFKVAASGGRSTPGEWPLLDREAALEAFVAAACWEHHTHGANAYAGQASAAMRLLARHPDLADRDLPTAVICGNLAGVERVLADDPALATTKAGPRGWEPLLYLAFARLPLPALEQNAVAIARLLLDHGADPNTYYMAGSAKYSVLVGVAGEGEQDAPRDQPYKQALYGLLLERGAGPYDIQVLYNTHFSGDMLWWLQLTYDYDVARGDVGAWQDPAWKMLDMGGYGPGSYFVLRTAIEKGDVALARWALEHGADPTVMVSTHPKFKPRQTLYQHAWVQGRREICELLVEYGAQPLEVVLEGEHEFLAACIRADYARVHTLAAEHPEYLQSPRAIHAAAEADRVDIVELLLDLGTPIEIENDQKQRPLHMAAGANAVRVAQLLIARGAEIDPRETQWGSTPLGFAVYGNRREMIQLLVPLTRSVWHLAWLGEVDRLRDLLQAEPHRAKEVTPNGGTPLMWLPDDDERAGKVVDLLLAHGADPTVRTKQERMTAAEYARQRGLDTAARKLAAVAPLPAPSEPRPTLQKFEALAKDLVVAFESGEPRAIGRLVAHYGGQADWERVREGVRHQLRTAPESDVPGGYFALPQARLVIARLAGFQNWDQLVSVLGPQGGSVSVTTPVPARYRPDLGPGMIQPVEMAAGFRVKMRDGSSTTTTQVWGMLTAARNGDLERVMELANATPGLVLCDYNYMPPLHLAVREGHLAIVRCLADRGAANPNHVTYPYRETLITVAQDRGSEEIATLLERRYADADRQRKEEEGGEIEYDRDAERERFQRLVNNDAITEVEESLAHRPELALDEFASWSEGILSMPANRRNRRMLELLLLHGAQVPQVTKWGAWYYFKHVDIAAFLLERGMNPHHMNCHHTTLLHDMAYTGDTRKAALLLEHGVDIDALDEEFRSTPLGLAARFGQREMVEFLIDRGANPNASGAPWATPLEWAKKKGHPDIESQLRSAGAVSAPRRRPAPADAPPEPPAPEWNSERSLGVRPDMAAIEREVDAEGGGGRGRQIVAHAYGAETWERLAAAVRLVDALWRDELDVVREIIDANPSLLHEHALIRTNSNWGPPMSYAANLGRNRIIRFLHERGARDIDSAMDRAVLQGQLDTARMLYQMGATPPDRRSLDGPAETLNAEGMALLVELGVELSADTAPVEMVLGTYSRNPLGKHHILEMFVRHGVPLPDTPPMAIHRGRLDLLEKHWRRDPQLLSRTFSHREMFPPELGCHDDESRVMVGTPLGGSGLLNMCIEYDEMELASWMVDHGADVNLRARVDADGFGGHAPLFNTVVCLGGGRHRHGEFAKLLLSHGADPSIRATLRKALRDSADDSLHEYHDVTALEWGTQFHDRSVVNEFALNVIRKVNSR